MPAGSGIDSTALCGVTHGKHVLDIGGKRRIGVDVLLELVRGDAELDREPEYVDQLLTLMPDKVRAENAIGRLCRR